MKTSKQERIEEYTELKWRNMQNRLFTADDIRRYVQLRNEIEPKHETVV